MGKGILLSKKFLGTFSVFVPIDRYIYICICTCTYIYIYRSLIRFLRFILKTNRSLISAQCKFITVLKTNIKKRGKSVEI